MARLLIYPKQQRYNVRYEKNWIFIEANQFFYYFYLEMQPPDKGEEEHFHTRNPAGQSYARDTTIEKRTDLIVRCVW